MHTYTHPFIPIHTCLYKKLRQDNEFLRMSLGLCETCDSWFKIQYVITIWFTCEFVPKYSVLIILYYNFVLHFCTSLWDLTARNVGICRPPSPPPPPPFLPQDIQRPLLHLVACLPLPNPTSSTQSTSIPPLKSPPQCQLFNPQLLWLHCQNLYVF